MAQEHTFECVEQNDSLYSDWDPGIEKTAESTVQYRHYVFKKVLFMAICISITFITVGVSISIGEYPMEVWEAYQIIIDHVIGNIDPTYEGFIRDHVVWDLRLPRIVIAIVAGAGLAVAGATMQSTLRNPLADPYTTGISSGAGFGATLAICYGVGVLTSNVSIVVNAFVFSLIPAAAIVLMSSLKKVSPVSMIMAGIAIMYIFNACTTVLKLYANPDSLAAVYQWQVGSLEQLHWDDVPIMFSIVLCGSIFIMTISNKLNILAAGDESAKSLGINASQLRIICLVIVSLMAASIVSFTGIIGFVGLVAPHAVRIFIGADNKYVVPASITFGAALLLISDLVGRTIIAPSVLQVGVVTAFLGGPLFLWLILHNKKEVW